MIYYDDIAVVVFCSICDLILKDSSYTKEKYRYFTLSSFQIKMSEKQKRSALSLELKQFIIKTKAKNPEMSYRRLSEELLLKFSIKTSRSVICRTLKAKDEIISLQMENPASKKKRTYVE